MVHEPSRNVARWLLALVAVMLTYWILWFTHRSLVASSSTKIYVDFENSFPFADGLLTVAILLTAYNLWRDRPAAVFCGLIGAGMGFYLFAMDVLFDLEHGIWMSGAGGVIELMINVTTLIASSALARWLWRYRHSWGAFSEQSAKR